MLIIISIFLISLIFSYFVIPFFLPLFICRKNYQDKSIPSGFGLIYIFSYLFAAPFMILLTDINYLLLIKLFLLTGMTLIGFIDDFLGDSNKGFKEHLKKLLKNKYLTSGLLKAIMGGLLGINAALLAGGSFLTIFLNTLLVPLSVNTFNLMDVRPGRALKLYLFLSSLLFLCAPEWVLLLIMPIIGTSLALFPIDLKENGMLGDAGSNLLGASVGFSLLFILDLPLKIIVLSVLLLAQWIGDTVSFTKIIENNRCLKFIDNLGRR